MSAITELDELRELEDGWCGEGSLAPVPQTFDNALELIQLWHRPETDVTPNTNGTISFEWPGGHLEIGLTRFSMYSEGALINGDIKPRDPNKYADPEPWESVLTWEPKSRSSYRHDDFQNYNPRPEYASTSVNAGAE